MLTEMKLFTGKREVPEKKLVRITWKRDAETFNLLSLDTKDEVAASPAFPLQVFRDTDSWYTRMLPEDSGKELWLLKQVYQKGSGEISYRVRGLDGSEWQVTESMRLESSGDSGRKVINGKWICEKK